MDLHVVGFVVFSVVAVVDSFAAQERKKISLLMIKKAQRPWYWKLEINLEAFQKSISFYMHTAGRSWVDKD